MHDTIRSVGIEYLIERSSKMNKKEKGQMNIKGIGARKKGEN